MPVLDSRPRRLDHFYRPGDSANVRLEGPAGWLDDRTFTATLNGTALTVNEDDDALVITVSSGVTTANPVSAGPVEFRITETGGNVMVLGTWKPSLEPATGNDLNLTATLDALDITLNVTVGPAGGGGGGGGGEPSGPAGGVLSGTYPNPGFAVNMAEQTEVDNAIAAEAATRAAADTALDGRLDTIEAISIATDAELASAVGAEATTRAAADTALDGRLDAIEGLGSLATDAELAAAISGLSSTYVAVPGSTVAGDVGKALVLTDDSPLTYDWLQGVVVVGTVASPVTDENLARPATSGTVIWYMDTGVEPNNKTSIDLVLSEGSLSALVETVTAGKGVIVDNTDPENPVVRAMTKVWNGSTWDETATQNYYGARDPALDFTLAVADTWDDGVEA